MQRRSGVVAAHSLDHVAFDVPSLAEARKFYTAFGLDVTDHAGTLHVAVAGDPRPWLVLHEGRAKKLRHISFGIYAEDLPTFRQRAEKLGATHLEPVATGNDESLWVRDPHGVVVQLHVGPKRTIDSAPVRPAAAARLDRAAPMRAATKSVKPNRLSHALLFTPDLQKSIAFYTDLVGLRLSDDAGAVAFMHAPHGSDHHVLAFAMSGGTGLHHVSWDVSTMEDVGLGAMQMGEAGYGAGWGIGRHVLGSNYFYYVRDPWGSYSEYSFDIDYVPHTIDWPASKQKPEDGFFLWGPPPPADFVTNFELTNKE